MVWCLSYSSHFLLSGFQACCALGSPFTPSWKLWVAIPGPHAFLCHGLCGCVAGLRELPGMSYTGGNCVNLLMPENIMILSPAFTGQPNTESESRVMFLPRLGGSPGLARAPRAAVFPLLRLRSSDSCSQVYDFPPFSLSEHLACLFQLQFL